MDGAILPQQGQAEDLIVLKTVAWRDRDREDVARLPLLHAAEVHLDRVRDLIGEFGAAIDEPERLARCVYVRLLVFLDMMR